MYNYVKTITYYNDSMKYFCSVEEVLPFHWGIFPHCKQKQRLHENSSVSLKDYRLKECMSVKIT